MKIVHIADVHWRGLSRHNEYRRSFLDFFKKAKNLDPDIIYIGGDIVHSKTQGISPELIDNLCWWFTEMAKICPVHVILGNHDGLIYNKDRQDAITPIIAALNNENIYLYKNSGTYPTGIRGFNWCVFSCFDECNWDNVSPVAGELNIALYHGAAIGSLTDTDWSIDGEISIDRFGKCDFAMLGDIHRQQFLNEQKTIAYSGSSIQQNYGEDAGKGFLLWDIRGSDDFDVEFHEIAHDMPFITVEWQGSVGKTLEIVKRHPDGARFRVKSDRVITQGESQQIKSEIFLLKNASEVVFKNESSFDSSMISTSCERFRRESLRDASVQKRLIREYYRNQKIDDDFDKIDSIVESYICGIVESDKSSRNSRWTINDVRFNNTFSYGKDNRINFDNLEGVTGIFGKNAKGKSSIIGTLMYGLFNTSDRGNLKNIHVVNNRKNSCNVSIDVSVDGSKFRIQRNTQKNTTKKGDVWAATGLKIHKIDIGGEISEDISGEQRRDTETILRSLIGTSEDFLMTSLASQGEMNTFIREKATARKLILSKFLDLEIFEKIHEKAKNDSQDLRHKMKNTSDTDWEFQIKSIETLIEKQEDLLLTCEKDIENKRQTRSEIDRSLATLDDYDVVTDGEIELQKNLILEIEDKKDNGISFLESLFEIESDLDSKLCKILSFKEEFSIESLREKLKIQNETERSLMKIKNSYALDKKELDRQKKSIRKLSEVPCSDRFPSCMFIKDSHKDKKKIEKQSIRVTNTLVSLRDLEQSLKNIFKEDIQSKIEKYEKILSLENETSTERSSLDVEIAASKADIEKLDESLKDSLASLDDMMLRISEDSNSRAVLLRKRIISLDEDISILDEERISYVDKIARLGFEMETLTHEWDDFESAKRELRVYDMIMQAVSKKGIPLQIIADQLPKINLEIANILQGVVDFTVELETDYESNSMDIYINYGDSRRVIETASGMEKMISSLAIRVGLINISSLPKTNMLMIDEGFGALDETNLESCGRLLNSLKKWFKNIVIISHVEAIKDVVDNTLDIVKNGKDAKVFYE